MKLAWGEISYQLFETGFFDWRERDKTYEGIKRVIMRMSDNDVDALLQKIGLLFIPSGNVIGRIRPFYGVPGQNEKGRCLVYFSPELEKMAESEMDKNIALEFARVLVGVYSLPNGVTQDEQKAISQKASKWGFN